MSDHILLVITHFYHVITFLPARRKGAPNSLSQTAFLPNFLQNYLFICFYSRIILYNHFLFGQG